MCAAAPAAAVSVLFPSQKLQTAPPKEKKKKNLKIFSTGICCWRWTKGEEKIGNSPGRKNVKIIIIKDGWMDGVGQAK
jgi:hypothetical protein